MCFYLERWAGGGIESFLINHLKYLPRQGLQCEILVVQKENTGFDSRLTELGIPLVTLFSKGYRSPILRTLAGRKAFQQYMKKNQPDIVWLNMANAVTGKLAKQAKQAGVKTVIAHAHSSGIDGGLTAPVKRLAHHLARYRFLPQMDVLLACSQKAAAWTFALPPNSNRKVRVFPNGIPLEHFLFDVALRDDVRKQLGWENMFVIGTVGRCSREKNQLFLLKALAQLAPTHPTARLLLVGDGPERANLAAFAQKNGLDERIHFTGTVSDPKKYYMAMDAFALPSIHESFGLTLLEAQVAGLPSFVSDKASTEADVAQNAIFLPIGGKAAINIWAHTLGTQMQPAPAARTAQGQRLLQSSYNIQNSAALMFDVLHKEERQNAGEHC